MFRSGEGYVIKEGIRDECQHYIHGPGEGSVIKGGARYQCQQCINGPGEEAVMAPNDTAYKRWSCHSGLKLLCKLCRTSSPPAMGARFTVLGMPAMRTRWMAGAVAHKSG